MPSTPTTLAKKKSSSPRAAKVKHAVTGGRRAQSIANAIGATLAYEPRTGVDAYVMSVNRATPMQIVQMERAGIRGVFLKDLSKRMNIASSRLYSMLGLPKATAEKKAASGAVIAGSSGQSAIGMIRLLGLCENIVANSTAKEAHGFDAAKWLGAWLERPQACLGGQKPADLMDTSTGVQIVARLLGSIESGSYQ